MKKNWLFLLVTFPSNPCQKPLPFYFQLLPADLCTTIMKTILSTEPLWQDDQDSTRIEQAVNWSKLSQEIYQRDLDLMIITRMRSDLQQAKKTILEPFKLELSWIEAAFSGRNFPPELPSKKPVDRNESPKLFQTLLSLKPIISYYEMDKEWIKEFLASKKCGGTLRKHMFINAMQHKHTELVNYLWSNKYRRRIIGLNTRNRSFLRMAQTVALQAGYQTVHEECKSAYDELTKKIKDAQVYYPG